MPIVNPEIEQQFSAGQRMDQSFAAAVASNDADRLHLESIAQQRSQIGARSAIELASSIPKFDTNLYGRIERQRKIVRDGQYTPLGQLERIQIEASGIPMELIMTDGRRVPNPLAMMQNRSASIDWMKHGPLIGVSLDSRDLVIIPPILRPPDLPDPNFEHPATYDKDGNYLPDVIKPGDAHIPRVSQELAWFTSGVVKLGVEEWMVFQPIHQIALIGRSSNGPAADLWRQGALAVGTPKGFMIADWTADEYGYHCMLLYNPNRQQAHILGGLWRFRNDV